MSNLHHHTNYLLNHQQTNSHKQGDHEWIRSALPIRASHQVQHKAPLFACTETQPALKSSVQHVARPGPPTSFSLFGFSGWQLFVRPEIKKPRGCVQQQFQRRQQRDQTKTTTFLLPSSLILLSFSLFLSTAKILMKLAKKVFLCLFTSAATLLAEIIRMLFLINFMLWVMDHIWKGFLFVENYQRLFPSPPLHSDCCFYNLQLYYFGSESALALTCFRTKQAALFRKTNKKSFNKPTAPSCPTPDTVVEENGAFSS